MFNARRARVVAPARPGESADLDARFRTLVQSPLRAGILRYLHSRSDEAFEVLIIGFIHFTIKHAKSLPDFCKRYIVP